MNKQKISRKEFIHNSLGLAGCLALPSLYAGNADEIENAELHEALYYHSTPRHVKCRLCPHQCSIRPGNTGDCRVRINQDGKLYTLAWSNPSSIHIDPVEKKPLYHFYPGSKTFSLGFAGCNFACLNCQNWQLSQSRPDKTQNTDLTPHEAITQAIAGKCKSMAYTYTEPVTFYEYTLETARLAKGAGIKNIIVSNGYINPAPLKEWSPFLDAANIDLKSFDTEIYTMLNNGSLQPVLDTLLLLKKAGVWLEITNLVIPGWTDDTDKIEDMCEWLVNNGFRDTPLHFSRFFPAYKLSRVHPTPMQTLEKAKAIALRKGLEFVYLGNIEPGPESTYCPRCKTLICKRKTNSPEPILTQGTACSRCGYTIPGVWK